MQKAENCILLIQSMYPSFHRVEKKLRITFWKIQRKW
ncbi:hypothetical protein EUBC25_23000 [Claveliimonas bilis]|nr:hypothetical protein EUBC25_23000 [Claveliimonas bilis]